MRVHLTDKRLSQPAKRNRREEFFDSQVRGLKARRGSRTGWVFGVQGPKRVGEDGKTIRLWKTLGPWSPSIRDAAGKKLTVGLSVAEARIAALETLQDESEALPKTGRVRKEDSVHALAESFLAQRYPENEKRREKVRALLEHDLDSQVVPPRTDV